MVDCRFKMISIEYCHIDPSAQIDVSIEETNRLVRMGFFDSFFSKEASFGLMIDDVHTDIPSGLLEYLNDKLLIKPDVIYLESSFIPPALFIINYLRCTLHKKTNKFQIFDELSNQDVLMRIENTSYKTSSEFLLSYRQKMEKENMPSCPTLVAASYLHRLGYNFEGRFISPLLGQFPIAPQSLLNVLPARFLNVEDKAHALIKVIDEGFSNRIGWYFYPPE